ncbi:MAG: sugar ABC transporter permease [Alphaproteobacteria bacterium]|nr:sugar ABC transporter permease [Alphaproteobacteria bacterium]
MTGAGLRLLGAAFAAAMNLLEPPFRWLERRLGLRRIGWVFVAPNLAVFAIFVVLPMLLNFHYAVTGSSRLMPADRPFVGLENFATLLACEDHLRPSSCGQDRFWRAVYNTLGFVALQVGFMVAMALVTALALNGRILARGFFRAAFFYPVLLSPVVVALVWKWILQRDGILNALIVASGGERLPFLLDPGWAFFWTVFVSIWAHMGFYTLILLAGLQGIPADLYEAATMDGTPRWRMLLRITLPLLMPTMMVVLVLALIRAVQAFDEIYVLTGGGPGTATQYVVQYIYETAFTNSIHIFGLAAAASILVGAVLLVLTLVQFGLGRRKEG